MFAAVNDTTGQRVAIKYLGRSLVDDPACTRESRAEAEQLRTVDAARRVRVFHYAEQPRPGAAVVMELIDGVSLSEMITRRGPLGTVAALVLLKDTLLGLAAAHSRRAGLLRRVRRVRRHWRGRGRARRRCREEPAPVRADLVPEPAPGRLYPRATLAGPVPPG